MRRTADAENAEAEPRDVVRAVARIIGFPVNQVNRASRLHEDLGLDVQDASELIEELEHLYHTEVPARCDRSVRTIGDIERVLDHQPTDAR
jgi:acyl carrier protein